MAFLRREMESFKGEVNAKIDFLYHFMNNAYQTGPIIIIPSEELKQFRVWQKQERPKLEEGKEG